MHLLEDGNEKPHRVTALDVLWGRLKEHPLARIGPGLITGVADDDPSGIATYSQAGAQFGLNMLWTMPLAYPLMAAIQAMCAQIGRVSGQASEPPLPTGRRTLVRLPAATFEPTGAPKLGTLAEVVMPELVEAPAPLGSAATPDERSLPSLRSLSLERCCFRSSCRITVMCFS